MHRTVLTTLIATALLGAASPASAAGSADGCVALGAKQHRSFADAGRLAVSFRGKACPSEDGVRVDGSAQVTFDGRRAAAIALDDAIVVAGKGVGFSTGPDGFRGRGRRVERRTVRRHAARIATRFAGQNAVAFDGAASKVTRQLAARVRIGRRWYTVRATAVKRFAAPADSGYGEPDGGAIGDNGGATGGDIGGDDDGGLAGGGGEQTPAPIVMVRCWDNSMAESFEACPVEPIRCWNGTIANHESQCPPQIICWNGAEVTSAAACPAKPRCRNGVEVDDAAVCGTAPVAYTATKNFVAGATTHTFRVNAADAEGDIVAYRLVSRNFDSGDAFFSWNGGTGQFTLRRPTASAKTMSFSWRAVDSYGNESAVATFTFRFI